MRVKRGIVRHRRHKKIRALAKGYRGMRRTTFKKANEAVIKAGLHAYRGRKLKKRQFRSLWIVRLSAAVRARGVNYSRFARALRAKNIALDRKILSELAIHEPAAFEAVLREAGISAREGSSLTVRHAGASPRA